MKKGQLMSCPFFMWAIGPSPSCRGERRLQVCYNEFFHGDSPGAGGSMSRLWSLLLTREA
jgi:hypothetical protein